MCAGVQDLVTAANAPQGDCCICLETLNAGSGGCASPAAGAAAAAAAAVQKLPCYHCMHRRARLLPLLAPRGQPRAMPNLETLKSCASQCQRQEQSSGVCVLGFRV